MARRFDDGWVPPQGRTGSGVFTARDALAAGMTPAQVRRRVETGRWTRIGGVLCLGEPSVYQRAHAAATSWPRAVVCLSTAALLHRLPVDDDGLAHVVVPSGRPRRGIMVPHRFGLETSDVTRVGLVPVTTKRRTIIDCLGRMSQAEAERLVAWVATRKLLSANELERWLEARRGAWGNAQRRISERRLRTGAINPAEERLHAALHAAGITGWTANEPLLPILGVLAVAYVYFADVLLVVEIDGRSAHGPAQFQQDRDRHNALVAAGCTPLHFTWEDVRYRPDHVVATIARQLEMLRRRQVG